VHEAAHAWREDEVYLFGVDLYNAGFFWEAHEAWEGPWNAARAAGHDARQHFLQGLIKCGAACVKSSLGQERGVSMLVQRGTELLEQVAAQAGPTYLGLDLESFINSMRRFAATTPLDPAQRPVLWLVRFP